MQEDEQEDQTGVKFSFLDVHSTRQGSLRLWAMFYSVFILAFMGLYLTVGAVLNYNQEDADQRDMVTNFRLMLGGRIQAHEQNRNNSFPSEISMGNGDVLTSSPLASIEKSRAILTDPRLLPLWQVIQPMVAMRVTQDPIRWRYFEATLPSVSFPPFAWDAKLFVDMSFQIPAQEMLFSAQLFNALPKSKRPTMEYSRTASDRQVLVWTITATFRESLRAFKVSHDAQGNIEVQRVSKVLCEVGYSAMDIPATFIQVDKDGRPDFKRVTVNDQTVSCEEDVYFQTIPECRNQVFVPFIQTVSALQHETIFAGPLQDAPPTLPQDLVAEVEVEVRDLHQPKPYAPLFTGFGEAFFVGFSLLLGAVITLVSWFVLRFHVVIRNVRVNEGRPPMFYQGMLRFRGW